MSRRAWFHVCWASMAMVAILLDTLSRISVDPGALVWPFALISIPPLGALILINRPGNRIGSVFAIVGVTAGIFSAAYWAAGTWPEAAWGPYLGVIGLPGFAVVYWGIVSLLYLFPNGTTLPGWWRWLYLVFTIVALGALTVVSVISTETLDTGHANPLFVDSLNPEWAFAGGLLLLGVGAIGGIASLVSRFRASVGVERAQLKVFLAGAVAFVVIVGLALSLPEAADPADEPWWGYLAVVFGFFALPGATVLAILRYRLFEIDRLVSRTVTYVVVVAVLVGVFAGLIVGIQALLPTQSDLAVAASTLAVAALFNPLRRRVQRWVDRRFNRSRYDAEKEIETFAGSLREAHDLEEITDETLAVVESTMEPRAVGIWVRRP